MAPTTPKRISQTQIANELGYSQALVSMVLNSRKQGISEKAYQRIWDYATTHGYSPRGMSIDSSQGKVGFYNDWLHITITPQAR